MLKRFDEKEVEAVKNVVENGKYLSGFTTKFRGGEEVQKFEKEFAKFIGVKYALTVNSGTTALFVAFKTAMEYGKKIKNTKLLKPDIHIPAYTFTADPSAALQAKGKVVFEDIDKKSYCMLTPKTHSAICVPTHLLGNAMTPLNFGHTEFSIEDCCQALGTEISGKKVGSFGKMSVFSFQETKHITTLGEGGMICSNDEEVIEIAAAIRNHAEFYLQKNYLGYNFRMTEAQAAFGRIQLKKINSILKMFRKNAQQIMKNLPNGITFPHIDQKVNHSFLILGCIYDKKIIGVERDVFLKKLKKYRKNILKDDEKSDIKGINMKSGKLISSGYNIPLYNVPLFKKFKPKNGFKNVENIITKSLWMDIHKFRTHDEISEELDILNKTIKDVQR